MKIILQYDLDGNFIREWGSLKEAADAVGLKSHSSISAACGGYTAVNTVKGFMWRNHTHNYQLKIESAVVRGAKFKEAHGIDAEGHNEIIAKRRATNKIKYGADHHMQTELGMQHHKHVMMLKYGFDNAAKHPDVIKKISTSEAKHKMAKLLDRYPDLVFKMFDDTGLLIFISVKCGHEFLINRQLLVVRGNNKHTICTICNDPASNHRSEIEDYLSALITSKFPDEPIEFNVKGLVDTRHELDIYLPRISTGIEVNGIKYHNDAHGRGKSYHLNKTEMFNIAGIRLLHYFDDEIAEKSDIILSTMENLLGKSKSLYARSCDIITVSSTDAVNFLDKNHLQGSTGSTVRLGLQHEGKLVALMTFGPPRKALGGGDYEWELVRFCNALGIHVVGGANRLFENFIRQYNPTSILSFANRRWSRGNLYHQLGFVLEGYTDPGYWYFYKNKRVHRFSLRKDVLVKMGADPKKTEQEITEEMKIPRIYDCGNIRFTWTKKN